MDTTGGYQSLLGLTSINSNSSTIDVLDVENININGVIDLSQAIVGGLTTSQVDEGLNLYYTDTRVNNNSNVSSNTTHRDRTDNPHAVTATQVGIDDTDDISEGVTNLYYTDIRFDGRLATKTTTSLAEGSNLYYTDVRFDNRFGIKTTTNLTEGANLYYTDARFDTRLATKTTTNLTEGSNLYYTDVRFDTRLATKTTTDLTEGTNLYYTDARFDTRFGIKTTDDLTEGTNLYYTTARANADFDTRLATKTTTNLTEGTNLYYTDARFDTRFGIKTTTNLAEGTNLYYTEARVSANTDVKANSDYRAVGHLPLSGGTLSGNLDMGNYDIDNVNQVFIDRKGLANNKIVLYDNGTSSTTDFYGFGIQSSTLVYNVNAIASNHKFYYLGTNELFRIGHAGVFSYRNSNITGDLTVSGETNIGGAKISRGATNGLQLYGTSGNISGPHIQAFVSSDTYPVYQQLNWTHNNINLCFDAYYDGSWRSSSISSNLLITKGSTSLSFLYDSGNALGAAIGLNTGLAMNLTNGLVSCKKGLDVTGNITVSGTVDGVDVATLNTTVNNHIANTNNPHGVLATQITDFDTEVSANTDVKANSDYRGVGHLPLAGGTLTGNLTLGTVLNPGVRAVPIAPPTFTSNTSASPDWIITSSFNSSGWKSFNDDGDRWQSNGYDSGIYFSNTSPSTTYDGGSIVYGHYLQLKIPTGYRLNPEYQFRMDGQAYAPGQWYVLISDNGSTWTSWDYQTTQSWPGPYPEYRTFTGGPVVQTNYIRFVFTTQSFTGSVGGIVEVNWINLQVGFEDAGESMLAVNSTGLVSALSIRPPAGETLPLVMDDTGVVSLNSTLIADVAANTAKVSADGSIDTHSDVNITTPADGHLLTYTSGEWKNLAPSGGTYVKIDGTSTMTGNLNMGNQDIDNVNQVFVGRNSTTNNKIVLYDGGTPSTTAFYGFGVQSATLLYNVDASGANHKFYYGGTNELFRIGNAGVYSYRDLDVKGDLSISGEMNIGGAKIARGATNGLQLYGPSDNIGGPHIQAFVSTDTYPVFQQLNNSHGAIAMCFDSYSDGVGWRSSSSVSNALIYKGVTDLYFYYDSGIAPGSTVSWNAGFSMDLTNGLVSCNDGLNVTGNITVSGTVDGVDIQTLNTTANNAIPLASHNTYVPTIGDGTNNFTLTSATGHYTVIGNMCHVSFYVLWTSKGSASGTIRLSLPFTSATGPYSSMALSAHNGIDASLPSIGCFNLSATNYVVFFDKPVGLFAMNQTSFTNAGAICGSGFFYL